MDELILILPLVIGYILDIVFGDPVGLPHPVVYMGKSISFFEKRLNKGNNITIKGAVISLLLILLSFIFTKFVIELSYLNIYIGITVSSLLIFFCLAGKTLIHEVKMVFDALEVSLDRGREQLSRIVGRDTADLSAEEVKKAALETLAENLSDGVIAPLFWYAIGGIPAMMAYKMINTLDSMIGYKNERYIEYGSVAARIDDIANYIPARITAIFMILVVGRANLIGFVFRFGKEHASPNSGYPEAALAGILNCKFGGTHNYFGQSVYKPYIGYNERELTYKDMLTATSVNRRVEIVAVLLIILKIYLLG